jgi:hypothetical protein
VNGDGNVGLQDRITTQSLVDVDTPAPPLALYFFGTTPLRGTLCAQKSVQVAAPTSGNVRQIVTILGIGTPTVVIVEASRVTSPGRVDHAICSAGAADGTTSIAFGMRSRDAQVADTDTGRMSWRPGLILIMNAGANTIDGQAKFVQWVLDGVEIEWTDFPAGAYLLNFTFLYGIVLRASVHRLNTSGTQNSEDVVTVPYNPNVALVWCNRLASDDPATSSNNAFWHFGVACQNEGTLEQACWDMTDRDNRIDSGWGQGMRDDSVIQDLTQIATGAVTVGARLALLSFGTGAATFKTLDAALSFEALVVLIDLGANRRTVKFADIDSATTGTGTNKKVTTSSASGTWAPKALRAVGTSINV